MTEPLGCKAGAGLKASQETSYYYFKKVINPVLKINVSVKRR